MQTHVYLLPDLIPPGCLHGSCCVVLDVLRATTTIVTALSNGARSITPCLTIEQAQRLAQDRNVLLGGERHCLKPPEFHLGNSPAEYSAEVVRDREIAFTTTNGTKAMYACSEAKRIVIAAFTNLSAVRSAVAEEGILNLVCSGTADEITLEDTLLAGALAESRDPTGLNDQAALAIHAWKRVTTGGSTTDHLIEHLTQSQGGKNLQQVAKHDDIRFAAQMDQTSVVPIFNSSTHTIS
ncbi:MAG: 2-phosphosulfolactate phosphatase [Planctomycetota bacterium]|nr:2-phosphosulfolactate phosphatase [Planctomycetota bacterium]